MTQPPQPPQFPDAGAPAGTFKASGPGAEAAPPPAYPQAGDTSVAHPRLVNPQREAAPHPQSETARAAMSRVRQEIGKAIVGQEMAITGLVIGLLARGHILLEGVPGVAKTLLVRALATSLDIDMKRVQFTPDLMPGDITGSLVYDSSSSTLEFRPGPVFTNLMLADEINRTPPKTQSSLLEAMEERQVTVDGESRLLPDPFMVIATQNPIEFEGTYQLPEAELDRFMLKIIVELPPRDDEVSILQRHANGFDPQNLGGAGLAAVASATDLHAAQEAVRSVYVAPEIVAYIVDVCRSTRTMPSFVQGVSPRGATSLLAASRAWAWLQGRDYVLPDDVKALATATLGHRVRLRTEAELENLDVNRVLLSAINSVRVPQ